MQEKLCGRCRTRSQVGVLMCGKDPPTASDIVQSALQSQFLIITLSMKSTSSVVTVPVAGLVL